jgi:uncharacterized protein
MDAVVERTLRPLRIRAAALAALALVAAVASAWALDFPALSGRVVDQAGVIDPATRQALAGKLEALEAKTTDQLVVVTLSSLQGTTIEDFGVQLGRHWAIGQKDKNNGVLLIVAPRDRKVRIEVGYGLEGTLTDAIGRVIIENAILPRFRADDIAGGIGRGVDDIIQVLSGDAEDFRQRAAQRPEAAPRTVWPIIWLVLGGLALLVLCFTYAGAFCDIVFQILFFVATSSGRSSGSSGGFSGGGGSFGGGGSSGSW